MTAKKAKKEVLTLEQLVPVFIENRDLEAKAKKLKEGASKHIRTLLEDEDNEEFVQDDVRIYLSESTSNSIDSDKLMELVKETGVTGIIKTREYVDMDELDAAISRGEVEAELKANATKRTTSKRLLVGKA